MDLSLTNIGSGLTGTLIGILLPFFFNKFVLPYVSSNARLQKYLSILHVAAQAYREEFPDAFNDPDTQWDDYAGKILQYAAATNAMPADDRMWTLAQKIFLNSGFAVPERMGAL